MPVAYGQGIESTGYYFLFALRPHELTKIKPEKLLPPISPLDYYDIPYTTELLENLKKSECSPEQLKQAALETIHTLYPQEEWIHIYTDGSLLNKNENAGAGIYCKLQSIHHSTT